MAMIEREVLLKHKFGIYENEDEDGNALSYPRFSGKHAVSEEDILSAPTIDAAPVRHGRWIESDDGDGAVCSQCGCDFCTMIYPAENFNYCPNCGARMDGGD